MNERVMWRFLKPNVSQLAEFFARQSNQPFSYSEVGSTRGELPPRYDHDLNVCTVGKGQEDFEAAKDAIRSWKMFPPGWSGVFPIVELKEGNAVAIWFHLGGLYWLSASRIVYLVDESGPGTDPGTQARFGFAYGTLPDHMERGEECFSVAWLADDRVVYKLRAFSQPRYWLARIGKPLARCWQKRFVRDSQQSIKFYVAQRRA